MGRNEKRRRGVVLQTIATNVLVLFFIVRRLLEGELFSSVSDFVSGGACDARGRSLYLKKGGGGKINL